jgi:hypothetical protein
MLKVGGVPEHFNYAWRMMEGKSLIAYRWTDYAAGSGAMIEALEKGEQDICVVLTEAVVAAIARGKNLTILGSFVSSPLLWGIHLPPTINFDTISSKTEINFAISRFGSGSHIMAFVMAERYRWPKYRLNFKVVNNLEGAIKSHAAGDTDIFLWEKATTQPAVAAGHFSFYDVLPAPWPAFLVVSSANNTEKAQIGIKLLNEVLAHANYLQAMPDFVAQIARYYHLDAHLVAEWSLMVKWPKHAAPSTQMLQDVHTYLNKCGLQLPEVEQFEKYLIV